MSKQRLAAARFLALSPDPDTDIKMLIRRTLGWLEPKTLR